MTTALIDGDVFAYRIAAAHETAIVLPDGRAVLDADLGEAKEALDDLLTSFRDRLAAKKVLVALSVPRCFRYDVLPSYKGNRKTVRKPILLSGLKQHLTDQWGAKTKPKLEADDILGIWATSPQLKGKKVVVTIDKDLKQIPGWNWNPFADETPVLIDEHRADYWHLRQALMGDVTDGYKGCPGIGPKKTDAILETMPRGPVDPEMTWVEWAWSLVVSAYQSKGLTEADALQQARVARICRATDYDFDKQEAILWTP